MDRANDWQFQQLTVKSLLLSRLQSAIDLTSCTNISNGLEARSTKNEFSCGTGILPVHQRVVENGAMYQIDRANRRESPLKLDEIPLNRSKDSLGIVYISAIALKLAKIWQQPPQTIVAQLVENLQALGSGDFVIQVAPSGMIQFELTDVALAVWLQRLAQTALPLPESRILSAVSVDRLFPIQYSHARCCSLLRMAHRDRLIAIGNPDPPATPQIWSLTAPKPISWLDDNKKLRLVHPAEYNLISQLLAALDSLAPVIEQYNDAKPIDYFKIAHNLSEAFQTFYSQCRIWGEVKRQTPKLAQARLGLVLATQSLLRFILEELLNAIAPLEL